MFGCFGETAWQVLPADADDFEGSALRVCALVLVSERRRRFLHGRVRSIVRAKIAQLEK
jgi:hypothetical protein